MCILVPPRNALLICGAKPAKAAILYTYYAHNDCCLVNYGTHAHVKYDAQNAKSACGQSVVLEVPLFVLLQLLWSAASPKATVSECVGASHTRHLLVYYSAQAKKASNTGFHCLQIACV